MNDSISRQAAIEKFESWLKVDGYSEGELNMLKAVLYELRFLPPAESEQENYAEFKQEFIRMASYIDCLLECSDRQKETLIGFISRLAECMSWNERD